MKSFKKAFLFGFFVWLVPFGTAFIIYRIRLNNYTLFETIMPISIVLAVSFFAVIYFKKVYRNYLREGIYLGILWILINLLFDSLFFVFGPYKMNVKQYFFDVGLTYLIIPIITIAFGFLKSSK
jgi:hypothetical protein